MYRNNDTGKMVAAHQYTGGMNPFDLPVWTAPLFAEGALQIEHEHVTSEGAPIEKGAWLVFDFDRLHIIPPTDFAAKYQRLHP